ncbi:MAG: hypothetical protein OXG35_19060 [Acidobacteria bacterium]|nr:hypothetical protein [Acidobacteriota bacterium]
MLPDKFVDTFRDAQDEIARRKRTADPDDLLITTFEESAYGGYRVYTVPADMALDALTPANFRMPTGRWR